MRLINGPNPVWSGGLPRLRKRGFAPLPAREGLLAPEVATFTDATGWTTGTGITFDTSGDGKVSFDGTQPSNINFTNSISGTTSGNRHVAYMDMRNTSAGNIRARFSGNGLLNFGGNNGVDRHVLRTELVSADYPFFGGLVNSATVCDLLAMQVYDIQSDLDGNLDIYICAGQSNMVGASGTTGYDQAIDLPELRALTVSCQDFAAQGVETDGTGPSINANLTSAFGIGEPILAVNPLPHATINTLGVSPAVNISTKICDGGTAPSRVPIFVCCAAGGTDLFAEWNPAADARYYDLMVANVNALLGLNAGNRVAGMFWCQGESSVATGYAAQFKSMVDGLRASWGQFPIVIMQHGGLVGDTGYDNMVAEQQKLATGSGDASELAKCTYAARPAGAVLEADNVHYTGTSNRLRGDEAGDAMIALI